MERAPPLENVLRSTVERIVRNPNAKDLRARRVLVRRTSPAPTALNIQYTDELSRRAGCSRPQPNSGENSASRRLKSRRFLLGNAKDSLPRHPRATHRPLIEPLPDQRHAVRHTSRWRKLWHWML